MKLVVKVMTLIVAMWLPVSGFAAAAMPCGQMSEHMSSAAGTAQARSCVPSAVRHSGGQTNPLSLPCHGGSGSASCTAAALPSAPLALAYESSAVYHWSVDHRFLLFIPEQPERPPVVS
ncbi:MAG TPA: hypothetical protein VNE82_02210 [Candidatus Binataceae bacterium]|nr:hypothetical protein [Candidatus Binataceae bacterium]